MSRDDQKAALTAVLCWDVLLRDVLGRLADTTQAALRRHGWTGTDFEFRVCAFEQMRVYLAVCSLGECVARMDASFSRDPHDNESRTPAPALNVC